MSLDAKLVEMFYQNWILLQRETIKDNIFG